MSVFRFRKRLVAACVLACALIGSVAEAAPALWEVRDHDTTIYLFGAMHVLQPNVKWRTRAFDRAYARADKVWFETRADADPAEVQALVDRYGVDADRSLTEKLPPRTVASLRAALERD
ncbi:MAG TPA: TraB/GumN family protein, partial [Caulobacter sp.]|nr:TraB/GumN family protein [Caulobacter sp.]